MGHCRGGIYQGSGRRSVSSVVVIRQCWRYINFTWMSERVLLHMPLLVTLDIAKRRVYGLRQTIHERLGATLQPCDFIRCPAVSRSAARRGADPTRRIVHKRRGGRARVALLIVGSPPATITANKRRACARSRRNHKWVAFTIFCRRALCDERRRERRR